MLLPAPPDGTFGVSDSPGLLSRSTHAAQRFGNSTGLNQLDNQIIASVKVFAFRRFAANVLPVRNWGRVLQYFKPDLPRIIFAVLLLLLSIGANVLKPWPVALIVDSVLGSKPLPPFIADLVGDWPKPSILALFASLVFLFHLTQGLFAAGQNYLSIRAGLKGLARLRNQLFEWMQRLSLTFYQRMNQGDLIYRATWDTYSLQSLFQQGIFKFLNSFFSLVLMLVVMWQLNRPLTLLMLAIFPPVFATMYFFGRAMNQRSVAAHQADSKVTSLVQQNIASLPLVQSFTQEKREQSRFGEQVGIALQKRTSQHGIEVVYWLAISLLFGAGTAALTWWGAREILQGTLTVGELIIFLSYLAQLYEPLNQLTNVGATVADASAGVDRIFEILDTPDDISSRSGTRVASEITGAVQFENITFGYLPDRPVIRNLSLEIKAGETIGLIGPSGAGKTTLLNLLPRFYDPQNGRVLIDGIDIREFHLRSLRQQVAFVFQEPLLLAASVAENISYGRPKATMEEVRQAARLANAESFIDRLPDQFETMIGEGAARLSLGEKQRINIARAFLKNAPILLLDEPTSALDAESEAEVVDSLIRLLEGRTTLMVAHRLSTIQQVDRIVVIDRGTIIETGSAQDLLERDGYYARITSRSFGKV